jgi:transposase
VKCEVVAPTLVPVKAGDRVKTDRRDAEKLARSYRSGDLTPVWVPDAAHEALRDVRAREAAKKDQLRAKHRLSKFLLRHGRRPPEKTNTWTGKYWTWLSTVRFEHAAQEATLLDYRTEVEHAADRIERLEKAIDEAVQEAPAQMKTVIDAPQALRGVAKITATTLVTEVGNFSRFAKPNQLMVRIRGAGSERTFVGEQQKEGAITKPEMPICGACWSRQRGSTGIGRSCAARTRNASRESARPSRESPGRPSNGCTTAIGD